MDGIYTLASSSVSSLYGNVNCAVREMLLSKFPKNFFKYINCSTEFAYHNMRRQFGSNNSGTEIVKRQRPQLIIQPTYQEADRDSFLQEIPLTKNIDDIQHGLDARYLFNITKDEKYGYCLKFKLNRDRIEFEVRLIFDTLHQQLDCYKAMRNQMVWERAFSKEIALESVIPKSIIYHIGKLCQMNVERDEYMIPVLLQRLNHTSAYPITYKLRNASATDEYYMYYMHTAIFAFYDLNLDEGSKKGMVDDHYNITFRVSCDFNLPGLYVITGNQQRITEWKVGLQTTTSNSIMNVDEQDYIPLFTIDNFYSKYPPEIPGMRLLGSSRFLCEKKSSDSSDTLDISALFDLDQRKVIQFHTSYNMQPDVLVKIIVLKNNEELEDQKDYCMQWNSFILTIFNPDPDATYRFVIYQNQSMMNYILMDLQEHESHDKRGLNPHQLHLESKFPKKEELIQESPVIEEAEPPLANNNSDAEIQNFRIWMNILNVSDLFNSIKTICFGLTEF